MKKAWEILEEQYEDEYIFFYGCAAHIINLMIKDVVDQGSVQSVVSSSTSLIKEIKNSQIFSSLFRAIQKQQNSEDAVSITSLKLPGKL